MNSSRKSQDYQLESSLAQDNASNSMVTRFSSKVDVDVEKATVSNGLRHAGGSIISFHDVHYNVTVKEGCCSSCKAGDRRHIIKGISGIMKPGLNAIMGPTGSGKSSLLDILAGRKDPAGLSGLVLVDGAPPPDDFKRVSGYVVQNDIILGTLTVRESLWFSANLRLPRQLTKEQKAARIDRILNELGLNGCADTKIGTALIRGISGGEKKRTAIGIELITEPKVLFLDEPTTGLDASTANAVMKLLKRLSKGGRTVICSIHQPRFSIYRLFDSMTLLCLGKMAYHGPSEQILPYFAEQGYHCEQHNNPADFFLDVINGDSTAVSGINEKDEGEVEEPQSALTAEKLSEIYSNHQIYKTCAAELDEIYQGHQSNKTVVRSSGSAYVTPFYYQFAILSKRAAKNILRNPIASVGNLVVNLIIGIIFGLLYFQTDDTTLTGVQNILGVLFFITTNLLFGSISSLELFVQERDIFLREHVSGYYRVIAYFLAKMLADLIPVRTVAPIIFCSVTYWMVGLKADAGSFFFFMLMVIFTGYASVAIGLFYSASFETFAVATLFLTMTYVFSIIFAGLLVNIGTIFPWLSWLEYLSVARYSFAGMAINELRGGNYTQCVPSPEECNSTTIFSGESILYRQLSIGNGDGSPITDWEMWQNAFALGVIALGMFVLTYVQLCRMKTYT